MMLAVPYVKNLARSEGFRSRVLVVDDEPLIRWALSVGLTAAGFDAVAAANDREARAAAAQWPPPDVVLLDLHRDDCSVLLTDLQRLAPRCHVLVLGTCCDGRPGQWQGREVIAKPFDLAYVVERVRAVMAEPAAVLPE